MRTYIGICSGNYLALSLHPEPLPPLELSVESVCEDPSLCFEGHVLATWKVSQYEENALPYSNQVFIFQTPPENLENLCPVFQTYINYTIIELGVPENATSVPLPPEATNYTISPVMPGTSYIVQVSYVNDVGESQNNSQGTYEVH